MKTLKIGVHGIAKNRRNGMNLVHGIAKNRRNGMNLIASWSNKIKGERWGK